MLLSYRTFKPGTLKEVLLSGASNHRQACQCLKRQAVAVAMRAIRLAPRLWLLIARLTSSLRPSLTGMNLDTSEPELAQLLKCDVQTRLCIRGPCRESDLRL